MATRKPYARKTVPIAEVEALANQLASTKLGAARRTARREPTVYISNPSQVRGGYARSGTGDYNSMKPYLAKGSRIAGGALGAFTGNPMAGYNLGADFF